MSIIKLTYNHEKEFIKQEELLKFEQKVIQAHDALKNKSGLGNDFLGWHNLPSEISQQQIRQIEEAANKINKQADVLIVIGIGGSYLGARAVISALKGKFSNFTGRKEETQIVFAGHHMSADFINELKIHLKDKDFAINVISKSGTTTEPAISFRIFYQMLIEKYGETEAANRVYATTDKSRGALKTLATQKGFQTFDIPDDVGGRFSVLTPVGLLPIAVANINIEKLINGAKSAEKELNIQDQNNPAFQYAMLRNALYGQGKKMELLVNYSSHMYFFAEWWKQLYGESEGKDGKGIFPLSAIFTTDLHSLGQIIQAGERNIFETVIRFEEDLTSVQIPFDKDNLDELNYLAGKELTWINDQALKATLAAHENGDVPNIVINLPKRDVNTIGYLIYFFELSCALSGYLLGVNPFDQPGVEQYKAKMFELLGKK